MITIGYNQVQEKHVADSNSNAREDAHEAKKVYVGNKLAHVHANDNTEFALRQTLNGYIHEDNDLYAKVRSIRGNTKVWNQLVTSSNFTTPNSITLTTIGNNTFSAIGEASATNKNIGISNSFPNDHVYYLGCYCKSNHSFNIQDMFGAASIQQSSTFVKYASVNKRKTAYHTAVYFYLYEAIDSDWTIEVNNINVIDLTLIYGAGNEPTTVAEFEADFQQWFGRPIGAEPYDAGSLIPFVGTGIKSTGFNLWDEEWEHGIYSTTTGEKVTSPNNFRCVNKIKVFPNTQYYCTTKKASETKYTAWGLFYDKDDTLIKNISGSSNYIALNDRVFTSPSNAAYLAFYVVPGYTYDNDICINLSNPTLNGTYVPYKATTVPIPVTTLTGKAEGSTTSDLIFPDGMKSAGSVKDEVYVENGKTYAVKRVGSVDLGTLTGWNKQTDGGSSGNLTYFRTAVAGRAIGSSMNIVCPKYPNAKGSLRSHLTDKTIGQYNSTEDKIAIMDSTYDSYSASDFAAAMSGVMLYYELATPIVYEVDNYTLPLYYLANGTGTEELQSTTTTAPANMDIEYRLLEEEWYGIRWRMADDAWVSPVRIGNPRLHQELPIQSMMKRCALVNGVPKFISESNVDEYEDGTAVDYANTDIYVQIPEYYFEATKDDDGWCELKIHTKVKVGTKSRLYYEGAWLATLDNNVLGSKSYIDFNAIGSPTDGTYNAALFKNATNFVANTPHGGNGSTTYDDTEGCTIGRPKTSITIANFRTYANNNSNRHGIVNYDCWCSIMRLFMVEFCSFYSQDAIDDTLTVHKFRKGGLSVGVTSGLTNWSNFNGYNPLIPCGFTKSLGNRTGVIKMHYAAEGAQTSAVNMSVPSYRGIEEPFGDIYNFVDGIAIYGDGAGTQKASIYVATAATIDNNAYVTPSGANAAPTGYELLTDDAPYKEASDSGTTGWIKVWHWDEHGMFAPLKTGGNSATVGLTDYMYMYNGTGWRLLLAGGSAAAGGRAGLGCFYGSNGFGHSTATIGSRLLYTPAS